MGIKQELRRYIREQKREHTPEELAVMSEQVCRRVLAMSRWQDAATVLLYYPLPDEVDTRVLIDAAVEQGKRVLLPVVVGDDLELRVYAGTASLQPGAFGILEPCGNPFPLQEYGYIDLAIIPGMAFNEAGNRLGRGKGYYDRLLPRLSAATRMGICFPFQLLPTVPSEPHDIQMQVIITDQTHKR